MIYVETMNEHIIALVGRLKPKYGNSTHWDLIERLLHEGDGVGHGWDRLLHFLDKYLISGEEPNVNYLPVDKIHLKCY